MKNATLEQRAKLTTKIKTLKGATRTTKCHYCGKELQIPNRPLKKNTEYKGFYVSSLPLMSIFCNKNYCFWMFTED